MIKNSKSSSEPVIAPVFLVAFSGHRPKAGVPGRSLEDLSGCASAIEMALRKFQNEAAKVGGCIHFLTSLAEGADLAAAKVAKELEIPTHFFLPFPEDRFRAGFEENTSSLAEVSGHLERAHRGIDGCTVRISASNHAESDDTYADTNFAILSHADAVITVAIDPEGSPGSDVGSQQVWQDASKRELPRINVDPCTQKVGLEKDLESFANCIPGHTRCGLDLLTELTDHLGTSLTCQGSHDCVLEAKEVFDKRSESVSQLVRKALKYIILCHGSASLLAGFALASALTFGKSYPVLLGLAAAELLLIGFAEYLHKKHHHDGIIWLRCRAAAENLNMLFNMRSHIDPLETIVGTHSPRWRRFVLSINLQSGPPPRHSLEDAKALYLKQRIENQITYFDEGTSPWSSQLYKWMRSSSILAFVVVLVAVLDKASHAFHWTDSYLPSGITLLLYFLPVALPLLAGSFLSLRQSLDLSRRQHRYPQVVILLKEAENDLAAVHSPFALEKVVCQVEESLLDERLEFETAQEIGFEH